MIWFKSSHNLTIFPTYSSMAPVVLASALSPNAFCKSSMERQWSIRSRVSTRNLKRILRQAQLSSVLFFRATSILKWLQVMLTTKIELLCKNWLKKLQEHNSSIPKCKRASKLWSFTSLTTLLERLRLHSDEQWKPTCHIAELLPTVRASQRSLCPWGQDASRYVCLLHQQQKL